MARQLQAKRSPTAFARSVRCLIDRSQRSSCILHQASDLVAVPQPQGVPHFVVRYLLEPLFVLGATDGPTS